ncbi:uncharacterized protein LOC126370297 [Pectinophora gossypiella]|uniref:uncharacterized protein LOC126370297 n=1 Tax=Pectinophora gossypiella TaxID=13191 RepID=UPI00214E2717|nr:uncharacterized protein LOC126370297 [Pectinophora gossypiella]
MDELDNNEAESKIDERRRSKTEVEAARDEIKKFKENLLQSVSAGDSIISESGAEIAIPSRSRSASRARDSLAISAKVLAELDETKVFELKEAFLLFDLDGDGCIDFNDLRGTLISLGEKVDEQAVKNMMSEAPAPLDFDGFVHLLGYQTLELDSEETLVDALSRWDRDNSGFISEERIRHDLMTWGDRFTEKEADYALDDAPVTQKGGRPMIDYIKFCSQLCGLRKAKKNEK